MALGGEALRSGGDEGWGSRIPTSNPEGPYTLLLWN